jgi:uncharacterized protein (UPF0261 family)
MTASKEREEVEGQADRWRDNFPPRNMKVHASTATALSIQPNERTKIGRPKQMQHGLCIHTMAFPTPTRGSQHVNAALLSIHNRTHYAMMATEL